MRLCHKYAWTPPTIIKGLKTEQVHQSRNGCLPACMLPHPHAPTDFSSIANIAREALSRYTMTESLACSFDLKFSDGRHKELLKQIIIRNNIFTHFHFSVTPIHRLYSSSYITICMAVLNSLSVIEIVCSLVTLG